MGNVIGSIALALLACMTLAFAAGANCTIWMEEQALRPSDEAAVFLKTDAGMRESVYVECPTGERWLGNGVQHGATACKFPKQGNYTVNVSINKNRCASMNATVGEPFYGWRMDSFERGLNLSKRDYPLLWSSGFFAHRTNYRLWGKNYGVNWKR